MTRHAGSGHPDAELDQVLAALIVSTRSKKRPLSLTEIAERTKMAVLKLGSYKAVAERIGLTPKMLRQFSYVNRLSPAVRALFASRKIDSVDAATHLGMLPTRDQLPAARAIAGGTIDTSDLRAVVQWRHKRPAESIASLIKGVRESKTQRQYVAEFIVRESRTRGRIVRALQRFINAEDIIDVRIDGAVGQLVLTRAGRDQLLKTAQSFGVPRQRVIPEMLYGRHSHDV